YDAVLLKDNHLAAAGGGTPAVKAARARVPAPVPIPGEGESAEQAGGALAAGAAWPLLGNPAGEEAPAVAARFPRRAALAASGRVTLDSVRAIAETGVHRVSIGALRPSAPAADVALEVAGAGGRA